MLPDELKEEDVKGQQEPNESNAVTFQATIDGQRTDRDGETKLTLLIPLTDLEAVRSLLGMNSKRLGVAISVIGDSE